MAVVAAGDDLFEPAGAYESTPRQSEQAFFRFGGNSSVGDADGSATKKEIAASWHVPRGITRQRLRF